MEGKIFISALRPLMWAVCGVALGGYAQAQSNTPSPVAPDTVTEFNTDVMDVADRKNVDISQFTRVGFVMPGDYSLMLTVNGVALREVSVSFVRPPDNPRGSIPCLQPDIVNLFGLKDEITKNLAWKMLSGHRCLDENSLAGMTSAGELSNDALNVSLPQAYLEYSDPNWDPPSRWDEGVTGFLFDYNMNATQNNMQQGSDNSSLSGNGTTGVNLGAWRMRADWQLQRYSGRQDTSRNMEWNRYYLYRALPRMGTKLTAGEVDLNSGLFDSFRFTGVNLATDDRMLPPDLQGYAPEVRGVARTNAKVTVTQQGRVVYESQVAPGPFRIQDLSSAVSGTLDVRVEEQDGRVQTFKIDTATIPYLTRPGMVRYSTALGRPSDQNHKVQGDAFATGEFSWGVTNGWSLFGGGITAKDYSALAVGIGRDLQMFGALSFDVTRSRAILPEKTNTGNSLRLSYSRRLEEIDGQVTFAGYRFSDKGFMSMSDWLDVRNRENGYPGMSGGLQKEMYTVMVSKMFRDRNMSLYGSYNHRTYWNRPDSGRYSLTLSKYLNIGRWKNISLNVIAYRNNSPGDRDNGGYISINIPWSNGSALSYSAQQSRAGLSQTAGWYDTIDENNRYSVQAGTGVDKKMLASGYLTHNGDIANSTLSASYAEGSYTSLGMSLQGGLTATRYGAALHPSNLSGGTRLMIDTGNAAGVPLSRGGAGIQKTNMFGKAVLVDLNSYWRNSVGVEVNALGDEMEVSRPLTELTITEGAIGYRKIDVLTGRKLMAAITLTDGSTPAFGATVWIGPHQTGMVSDGGRVWLTGVQPGVTIEVRENDIPVCHATVPEKLPATDNGIPLQLACQRL